MRSVHRRSILRSCFLSAYIALATCATNVQAGMPVHDHPALIHQLLQMIELQRQVALQLDMLENLEFTSIAALQDQFGELYSTLNQFVVIGYSIVDSLRRFDELFPASMTGDYAELGASLAPRVSAVQRAVRNAVAVNNQIVADQPLSAGLRAKLLALSAGAVGQTQAIQVNNELLGLIIQQQNEIQTALIANARAEQLELAAKLSEQERIKKMHEWLWSDWQFDAQPVNLPPRYRR